MSIQFAGESDAYREARGELLDAEKSLRRLTAEVASMRQALPAGHVVTEQYAFRAVAEHAPTTISLTELFAQPERSLVIYSFMYTGATPPCPMCVAFLDAFQGVARHAREQLNLAVVARADLDALRALQHARGWQHLPMYSVADSSYSRDYHGETAAGAQLPMLNVFSRDGDLIRHRYTNELFFETPEPGQDARHMDALMPLWNLFDYTPQGRPANWFPSL